MAFAAEKIRVLEINRLAVTQRQKIVAIIRAVAVQAPDSHAAVAELYILMDKQIFPSLEVSGKILLRTVTRTARSDGLRQGCQRDRKLLIGFAFQIFR
jgi:hypothetical protein